MVDSAPQVSVVIPCFNGERFVGHAIESLLGQTQGPVEILVVDDCSSDGSVGVVERYAVDGRILLIRHETNRGIAAARNSGLRRARGRFIGFLDQDDLWGPDKIERQLAVFEEDTAGGLGVVFCEVEIRQVDPDVSTNERVRSMAQLDGLDTDDLISRFFLGTSIPIISALIRRECFETVGDFDESIRSGADDLDMLVRIATRFRFAYAAGTSAVRQLHRSNFTDVVKMTPDTLDIIARTVADRPTLARTAARARSYRLFCLARVLHVNKEYARAKSAYMESIRARPSNLKALAGLLLCSLGGFGDALYRPS